MMPLWRHLLLFLEILIFYFLEFWHVQTLIHPYLFGSFFFWEMVHLLFWGFYYFILWNNPSTFIHGDGWLKIHMWVCYMHHLDPCYLWRLVTEHSTRREILSFYLSCFLDGAPCNLFWVDPCAYPLKFDISLLYFACIHLGRWISCEQHTCWPSFDAYFFYMPSLPNFWCSFFLFLEGKLSLRWLCPYLVT